jgi:peptidoglycan-associated lipoprotein
MKLSPIHLMIVATALTMTAACAKKRPADLPPPPIGSEGQPGTYGGSAAETEGERLRRDFVARAGSDTVYFGTDSHLLDEASRATLDAQARWLIQHPNVRVTIEGHCDERGTREYNLALGERRANAAKNFLAGRGVPASQMATLSWGKERPAAAGSDEAAWAQNRRAVTVIPLGL